MADAHPDIDSVELVHGLGTVEIVVDASQVGRRFVVATNALGMANLVWVRIEVEHFRSTSLGYVYNERGIPGTGWAMKGSARNFLLIASAHGSSASN